MGEFLTSHRDKILKQIQKPDKEYLFKRFYMSRWYQSELIMNNIHDNPDLSRPEALNILVTLLEGLTSIFTIQCDFVSTILTKDYDFADEP